MRNRFLFFVTLLVAFTFATSCKQPTGNLDKPANANTTTTDSGANADDIKKFIADFAVAMSNNDVVRLDKLWAPDFTLVTHDGEIFTKAQLLELLKSGTEKFESVSFENINVRTYGDTAVVSAHGTQKATVEGRIIAAVL